MYVILLISQVYVIDRRFGFTVHPLFPNRYLRANTFIAWLKEKQILHNNLFSFFETAKLTGKWL